MWRDFHGTEYALENGVLYLKITNPVVAFAPPQCMNIGKESCGCILEYCKVSGLPARFCSVSAPTLEIILEMYPEAKVCTDRAWSDYLYLSDDIIKLPGRKYSGQRNHINHFMRENTKWTFRSITDSSIKDVKEFIERIAEEHDDVSPGFIESNTKAMEALDNLELYGQFGGVLCANGVIVGASLGEIVGDTLFVHVEKADTAYHGAYPMLMNQFARMYAQGVKYINREEDDGIEGLRTSKTSYHPTMLLDKYMVEL